MAVCGCNQETWSGGELRRIEKSRPEDEDSRIRHPRMPIPDRAKIFAPFAALTGFEKVIEAENAKASTP